MKALYRRYRPKTLSEVIGQEQVTTTLKNSLDQLKISHAYLFIGPRGTGKTSVARILAHEINNFTYELEDDYVDIIEIDGASNRGIDNIRDLREKAAISPSNGKYKVYIIDEVHMLTKEAFNALLKTLEEPPEHIVFIMATTDAYKVPVTITSRAQTYTFKLASPAEMFTHLKNIAKNEKLSIEDEALEIIVRRGGGSFRDSLSLLDQISTLSTEKITKQLVISAMGLPEDEKISEILSLYSSGNVVKITTSLQNLLSSGIKSETIVEEMIRQILAHPTEDSIPLLSKLTEIRSPFAEAKLTVALCQNRPISIPSKSSPTVSVNSATSANPSAASPQPVENASKSATPSPSQKNNTPNKIDSSTPFDWKSFTERVRNLNDAVYSQLVKTDHELHGKELHIYPDKNVIKMILNKENNKKILVEASGGLKIVIHEISESPKNRQKDPTLSRISDIMGGEVINDTGGNPF